MLKYFILFNILFITVQLSADLRKITLNDCIRISLENHPNLMVSEESRKGAVNDSLAVKAKSSILINGTIQTVEYLKQNASTSGSFKVPGKDTDIGLFAGFDAKYTIYDGRQVRLEKLSEYTVDIAKLDSARVKNETIFNVKKSYFEYLFARENMEYQNKLKDKFKEKRDQAKVLYNTGQRPILEVTKAEVGYSESLLDFEKAKNNELQKKGQLFTSMGVDETEVDIENSDLKNLPIIKYTVDELTKFSNTFNPTVGIVSLNRKTNKMKVDAERARYYPVIDFYFRLGFQNTGLKGFDQFDQNFSSSNWSPSSSFSIQAAVPVYTGGLIAAKIQSAITEYNKSVYKEREVLIDIKRTLSSSFRNLAELSKQIKLSEAVVENSEKHLLLASKTYQSGTGSLFDLYDAESSLIKARLSLLSAKYNYLLTIAMIAQIVGVDEAQICKK